MPLFSMDFIIKNNKMQSYAGKKTPRSMSNREDLPAFVFDKSQRYNSVVRKKRLRKGKYNYSMPRIDFAKE